MDALSVFREHVMSGRPIREDGDSIILGDMSFPKDTPTNFRISMAAGEFYNLNCFYYFYNNKDLEHAKYILAAKKAGVSAIQRVDRKNVLSFFAGENVENIDRSAFATVGHAVKRAQPDAPAPAAAASASASAATGEEARKRSRGEDGTSSSSSAPTGEIRAINDVLNAVKIAELRAKKDRAKKAKPADGSAPMLVDEPLAADATREVIRRERVYDTRDTVLQVKKKDFSSIIQKMKQANFNPQAGAAGGSSSTAAASSSTSAAAAAQQKKKEQQPGYQRYNQPGAVGDSGGFDIDFSQSNIKPSQPSASGQYVPGSLVDAGKPEPPKPKKRTSKTPIIIVPAGATSMITLYNVKRFLEEGVYESSQTIIQQGLEKPINVVVNRKHADGLAAYRVVDNIATLKPDEWDRVVCVFVAGPVWQFKDWKVGSDPVKILAQIRGFHLKYKEDAMIENIKKWDVELLEISRSKRHLDSTESSKFWKVLDDWNAKKHPNLRT